MKKVLIIAPYEGIFPPTNGGMQRCFHIIHQASKLYDVSLVFHGDSGTILKAAAIYPAISKLHIHSSRQGRTQANISSSRIGRLWTAIRYRWIVKNIKLPADSSFLQLHPVLKRVLKKNKFDFIILEQLGLISQAGWIKRNNPYAEIVYDAHNVDSTLLKQKKAGELIFKMVLATESNLYRKIDCLFTCSEHDLQVMQQLNAGKIKRGYVLPNGVDTISMKYKQALDDKEIYNVLFCGSLDYEPNIEGISWFCNKIWPLVMEQEPRMKLYIVGKAPVPGLKDELEKASVVFIGQVDDVQTWYNKCNVAIAPLKSGSGTRLKILEAMSMGNPVVSTTQGAEGINYTDETDILVADTEYAFAQKIISLAQNKNESNRIRANARKLAEEQYDWNVAGEKMKTFMGV
ncbi:MAG: glycosyltransferase family 4 protein [Ferruginibacter sp.]